MSNHLQQLGDLAAVPPEMIFWPHYQQQLVNQWVDAINRKLYAGMYGLSDDGIHNQITLEIHEMCDENTKNLICKRFVNGGWTSCVIALYGSSTRVYLKSKRTK